MPRHLASVAVLCAALPASPCAPCASVAQSGCAHALNDVCQLLPLKLRTHPGLLQETKIVAAVAQSHHFAAINLHVLEQFLYTVALGCILQALNDNG